MTETERSFYPAEMAAHLARRWAEQNHPAEGLPADDALIVLFDRLYQASLMREEGEGVKCRIIVASPDDFPQSLVQGVDHLVALRFTESSPFTPHNVRKLAGAAGYYRAMLAVEVRDASPPAIWGMIITGTSWVNRFGSDHFEETPLPPKLVLQILAPGHLIAASGYTRVFESTGGKLLTEGFDPFNSHWLPERFSTLRSSLLEELSGATPGPSATQLCDNFVKDVSQSVIRHVLSLVRTRGHGGILAYLPDDSDNGVLTNQWFRFRVRFTADLPSLWFRTLLGRLIKRVLKVGGGLGLPICTWNDYRKMHDAEIAELDEALIGLGHFLADLMCVDGALVLGSDFRLIGFGGEILGELPVFKIHRALDLEAESSLMEPADTSGTRHRSAYRLVSGARDTIAVVVSQDGDVRFVAHHLGQLTYWPYLP
ncbi:putative sensor domain DACNV-containing protein [Aureliella helgolandensis]|uniref:Probable sensor domain-containing protein n=1 Tax=Aureliella helgolandensis TaxID=2527968 RepID=A0A518G931_9BACT|nr:diadenylate cyclase [Aureliella helgolandensis]QDV25105.1 hypothetical protein Q31a_34280 [Aureliella helgolandensis]